MARTATEVDVPSCAGRDGAKEAASIQHGDLETNGSGATEAMGGAGEGRGVSRFGPPLARLPVSGDPSRSLESGVNPGTTTVTINLLILGAFLGHVFCADAHVYINYNLKRARENGVRRRPIIAPSG